MRKQKFGKVIIFLLCLVLISLFEQFGNLNAFAGVNRSISSDSDRVAKLDSNGNLTLQANAAPIAPVVTIVLYFGEKHWCKERNIKSLMNIPKELDPYVNDYKMEVFEIAWLTDEQLEMFKSDFKVVARFFVNKRRNPDYVADDPTEIQHVDEVLKLLSVMTGDRDYENVICDEMKGQVKSMCDVAERLKNIGRQEGFQAGRSEGRSEERINAVKFAISLGASEEKILKQYSREEYEKALALMKA